MGKLNFVILESFLAQNPQLTDTERAEILGLDADFGHQVEVQTDTPNEASASMAASVGRHVFDETEIRTFLENNHISYEDLAGPSETNAATIGWRFDLARYIMRNLNDPILQKVIPENGFPLSQGSHLLTKDDPPPATGTRASHNFDLYLEYLENQLTQDSDLDRLQESLPHGPVSISLMQETEQPEEGENPQNNVDDNSDKGFISFHLRFEPLFWEMVDPLNEDPDLRLRFLKALTKANEDLTKKETPPKSLSIADKIHQWLSILTHEINIPIPKAATLPPASKIDPTWTLSAPKKTEFEKFISNVKTRPYLNCNESWPPSLMEKLFSFFEGSFAAILNTNPPSTLLPNILAANNIVIHQTANGDPIILRVVEWSTSTHALFSETQNNAARFASKTEPMTSDDRVLIDDVFSAGQISWEMMPLISFLSERDLVGAIAKQKPWLAGAFDSQSNEAIAQFVQEAYTQSKILSTDAWNTLLTTKDPNAHFLIALKNSERPKACLAFLLFLATQRTTLGENLRINLPYLFNQIEYDYAPYDKTKKETYRRIPIDEDGDGITDYWDNEIDAKADMHAAGNAWIVWDEATMALLADHLSEIPEKDLQEIIQKISNDTVEEKNRITQSYVRLATEKGDTPRLLWPPLRLDKIEKAYGRLEIEPLLHHLKFASTRTKITDLDPLQSGFVSLDDILSLTLTGAEREDLRRGLSHSLSRHDVAQTGFAGNDVIAAQLELLPIRILKKLILNNLTDYPSYLWDALFRKNPQEGLDLWAVSLARHRHNPQDSFWADQASYGYPHALYMLDPRADTLISKYRDELVALGRNENEIKLKLGEISALSYLSTTSQKQYERFKDKPGEQADYLASLWEDLTNYRQSYGPIPSSDLETSFSFLPKVWIDFFKWSVGEGLPAQRKKEVLLELCETLTQAIVSLTRSPRIVSDPLPGWSTQGLAIAESISDVFDVMVAELFNLINDDPSLHGGMAAYTAVLEQRFRSYHFSANDYGSVIDKLEPFADHGLAQGIYLAAAIRGHEWGWQHLDKDLIIKTDGDRKIINPENSYTKIFYAFSYTRDDTSMIRNLDRAQGGLSHFFARLDKEQGPLEWAGGEQLKRHFILATVLSRKESLPLSRDVGYLVTDLTKHPEEKAAKDLIRLLQKKYESHSLKFEDATAEEMIVALLYPARSAGEMLIRLSRYDDIDYPTTVTDRDKTNLPSEEIPSFKKEILDSFTLFASNILLSLSYKKAGLAPPLDGISLEISSPTPWLNYARLLFRAINKDEMAIKELWKYETKELSLTSDIDVFNQVCDLLLNTGRQVLLKLAPEYFTWGADTQGLKDDTVLGMAELSVPDANVSGVANHWANPNEPQESDKKGDRQHATMVFQTLLGNYTQSQDPTGRIWSYNLDENAPDLWAGIDLLLEDIIRDVEKGAPLTVINMSFGFLGLDLRSHDLAKAFDSESAAKIRDKLDQLRRYKIPLVISAGNHNNPNNARQGLEAFNLFGMLDPSIIMVGSTRLGPQGDYEMSAFSSPGNSWARSDVATLGEGYEFMTDEGVQTDVMGTSFSSPQVARLIAKMKEIDPNMSVETIQAILKMSSMDLKGQPESEGAGQIRPDEALYLTWVLGTRLSKEEKEKKAQELGVYNQMTNLEQLAKWIRRQVFFQNTFRQSYGE